VGEWEPETVSEREREREKEGMKAKSWWYLFSPVAASGYFSPLLSPYKALKYYSEVWAHIAVFVHSE